MELAQHKLICVSDGLVFYDQFSRLATHQIVLVSLGVAFLLLGVWLCPPCSRQVTRHRCGNLGRGGRRGGHLPRRRGTCLGGGHVEEPEGYTRDLTDEERAAMGDRSPLLPSIKTGDPLGTETTSPAWQSPLSPSRSHHPQPPPLATNGHAPFTPPLSSLSGSGALVSPTRLRRPRYGTLIPDLAPPGAPTGFSIGLGAASPGFVIRPDYAPGHGQGYGSMGDVFGANGAGGTSAHGGYGRRPMRIRSRSEGMEGIRNLIRARQSSLGGRRSKICPLSRPQGRRVRTTRPLRR